MQTLIEPKRKQCPSRISEAQHNLILELKEQGLPNLTIAKKVGVSPPTVRNVFNKQIGFMAPLHEQVAAKYDRDGENNLINVEDLDFEKEGGFFCIDKFAVQYQVTPFSRHYKSKIYVTN